MLLLKRTASRARAFGIEAVLVSPEEAGARYSGLMRTDDLLGALWLPGDGSANPSDLCQALAAGARQGGARIFEKQRVSGFHTEDGAVRGVKVSTSQEQQHGLLRDYIFSFDRPRLALKLLLILLCALQDSGLGRWPPSQGSMSRSIPQSTFTSSQIRIQVASRCPKPFLFCVTPTRTSTRGSGAAAFVLVRVKWRPVDHRFLSLGSVMMAFRRF